MTMLLRTLAVAFAAFCMWLTVRVVNRREKWAKRTLAALVGLPVLYVASFGPACWWLSERKFMLGHVDELPCAPRIYWPAGWLASEQRGLIRSAIGWYGTFDIDQVCFPIKPNDEAH